MFSVSFLVICLGRLQAGGKREEEKADTDVAKQLSDMTSVNSLLMSARALPLVVGHVKFLKMFKNYVMFSPHNRHL